MHTWITKTTAALAGLLSVAATSSAQPLYDAHVVEPWDDSYQLASSNMGDMNDLNLGVGSAYFDGTTTANFLWTLSDGKSAADVGAAEINNLGVTAQSSAIFFEPGEFQLVPHPNGISGVAIRDLNNVNVVCGDAFLSETTRAFIWDEVNGSRYLEDLGVPAPTWRAYAINDAGLLAGSRSVTGEPGDEKSFVLDVPQERFINLHEMLNPSGGGITRVVDVSESGYVTGEGSYADATAIAAFLWSEAEGFTFLPGLDGGLEMDVHPNSVNDDGTVVGDARDASGEWRAFIWNASYGMHDLETLADVPTGFNLEEAKVINENGWIVARGFWHPTFGPGRAVVFAPQDLVSAPDVAGAANGVELRVSPLTAGGFSDVRFRLDEASPLRLSVFDVRGREVALLVDTRKEAGRHEVRWDGSTRGGGRAAPGVYFVRLRTHAAQAVERVVTLR